MSGHRRDTQITCAEEFRTDLFEGGRRNLRPSNAGDEAGGRAVEVSNVDGVGDGVHNQAVAEVPGLGDRAGGPSGADGCGLGCGAHGHGFVIVRHSYGGISQIGGSLTVSSRTRTAACQQQPTRRIDARCLERVEAR